MSALKSVVDCGHAFLFACLGFEKFVQADDYRRDAGIRFDHGVEPLFRTCRGAYVLNSYSHEFSTGLLPQDEPFVRSKSRWHTLRRKDTPKPAGSYNVGLLYEGPSRVYIGPTRTHKDIARDNDCFVAWSRGDGKSLQPAWVDGQRKLFVARSGCGVIYARVTHYAQGRPVSVTTHVLGVEFTILDSDPNRDDMIRLTVQAQGIAYSDGPNDITEPKVTMPLGPVFPALLERARAGFIQHCKPIDPEAAQRIAYEYDQRMKYITTIRKPTTPKLIKRLRNVSLQVALDWVKEPYQLQMVVETISGRHEFWEHPPHYIGATYVHVRNMLERYRCSPERKELLWKWVKDFVEPAYGKQWAYTGD